MKKIVKAFLIALTVILLAGTFSTTTEAACKHSYKVTKTVKATCKKTGYKQYKCKKCGKKKKTKIKKKSHKYKLKKTVKAKCTKAGYKQYKCSKCKATKKTTLKKLGHKYKTTKTVKATCTKAGYKNAKCSKCKATKKTTLKKLGHKYKTTKTVKATCTKAGYENAKCSRCTATKKTTLGKLGHKYVKKIVKATCTEKGYTEYTCSKCGNHYKESEVSAKGHTKVEENVSQSGKLYMRVYCETCGVEISKTLIEAGDGCNTMMKGEEFDEYIDELYDIETLTFTDMKAPDNAELTDVSDKKDGSVVAWMEGDDVFVTTVDGKTLYANEDSSYMFNGEMSEIVFDNFDTSKVTDMEGMFYDCLELEKIDVSSFNTSKVTNMRVMFYNCQSLKELDLSNFDTSNVQNMISMFCDCLGLEKLNLDGFNTSNVVYMGNMFSACVSLKALDVSSFDTSKVEDMFCMFSGCRSLEVLDLNSFNVANVTDMFEMFIGCRNLKYLYGTNWSEEAVKCKDSQDMFIQCDSLVGVIPYMGGKDTIEYTIKNANPINGYFSIYGSEGHRPNNMTSEAFSMGTFENAIDEFIEDYEMKCSYSAYNSGESLHPESSSVDVYSEESVRYNIHTQEASSSNDPSIMIQIVRVNDVLKADEVGKSFDDWTYYSQHENQYLLYNDKEYVMYISVPAELSNAGFTMERVITYIDAYYEAATK